MNKWIYEFRFDKTDGNDSMKNILGGKGAALAEMSLFNIPVPPGFTISTEYCNKHYNRDMDQCLRDGTTNHYHGSDDKNHNRRSIRHGSICDELKRQIKLSIGNLESVLGKDFSNNTKAPLLLSVRSGSPISMPGMMDTILNLGLTDHNVHSLAKYTNNPKFAYDSYRRFIQMYGTIVMGLDSHLFEDILDYQRRLKNAKHECELDLDDLKQIVNSYKDVLARNDMTIPQDPYEQLWCAVGSVLDSWMNPRAIKYRELHQIPSDLGTAVNIQSMVFGNMGEGDCATGVLFTRNPSTGEKKTFGEFLLNAQGEDVVDGSRDAYPITEQSRLEQYAEKSMETAMPEAFGELMKICNALELHYRNMQDIEFTIENGKVWILQTRNGKRSVAAALRIARDMVDEGLLSPKEAINGIEASSLDQLLHCSLDPNHSRNVIGFGLPASPGAASGAIALTASDAEKMAQIMPVILVRSETSPDDITGMSVAQGIVTARGGMTSHAAVVARGMGKPCVCSVSDMKIDLRDGLVTIGRHKLREGDIITIDGSTGHIIMGEVPLIEPKMSDNFATIMEWSDAISTMKVRANAETITDAKTALKLGATGIGLCRTEHMFFAHDRILSVRKMIMASDDAERANAIQELEHYQKDDFVQLFALMGDLPLTIRLLDPPLHEFLPQREDEIAELADAMACGIDLVRKKVEQMREQNPMLGHRGCRLAITYPEIYRMQVRSIFEAALEVREGFGYAIQPEIMLPLVLDPKEIILLRRVIEQARNDIKSRCYERIMKVSMSSIIPESGLSNDRLNDNDASYRSSGQSMHRGRSHDDGDVEMACNNILGYKLGTMIELPRAALQAGAITPLVDFCSFGTNDLTQTTMGLSRDDSSTFMHAYIQNSIFKIDPFVSLDLVGVGELIKIAVERGRSANPKIKFGVCGEHGGDPASIEFFAELGIDYVSCSPYRVPIARLSVAQSAKGIGG